ncbi:carcinoembryonic antigen-related cell adhesion molecule 1-like isoform X1 [Xenia sp. Carnegie-2017]|uniref:carcinoembryonic antigen-related cell adhesion molecule 1-like isoform X1 n=1 Tax=Xenia sp. Carnegie-2017 TaxID=2897299 RepID=UPI001F033B77|nr:carcinoembryonic antigen-related cell adhesion molecule 1-like isoform X1 [Xenia sp. Carnegie-2017]
MATLTIARVGRDDNGPYRCEAKGDEKFEAEKTVQIIVNSETFNTKLTLQREGDKARLTCTAEGNPQPQFEIFLNDASVVNQSELVINEVSTKNVGDYTCRATNNLGSQLSQKVNLPLKGMSTTTPSATDTDPKAVKIVRVVLVVMLLLVLLLVFWLSSSSLSLLFTFV